MTAPALHLQGGRRFAVLLGVGESHIYAEIAGALPGRQEFSLRAFEYAYVMPMLAAG